MVSRRHRVSLEAHFHRQKAASKPLKDAFYVMFGCEIKKLPWSDPDQPQAAPEWKAQKGGDGVKWRWGVKSFVGNFAIAKLCVIFSGPQQAALITFKRSVAVELLERLELLLPDCCLLPHASCLFGARRGLAKSGDEHVALWLLRGTFSMSKSGL
jgi:hypothetical protein